MQLAETEAITWLKDQDQLRHDSELEMPAGTVLVRVSFQTGGWFWAAIPVSDLIVRSLARPASDGVMQYDPYNHERFMETVGVGAFSLNSEGQLEYWHPIRHHHGDD